MTSASLSLPDGALYALTWSIPRQFGGLTRSLLQRSCQIAAASGRDVVIITLADQSNLDAERESLRDRGLLVDGVSILNLWEHLGRADDDVWATTPFDPTITTPDLAGPADDVAEVVRPDGTVIARQRLRTLEVDGVEATHRDDVVRTEIWDHAGRFLGGWHGAWPLWRWWLDRVLARPAHVVVDSPNVADCLAAAPLADVATTYVVHNSHVSSARDAPYGRLTGWRSFTMIRSHQFDAVVLLTRAQRGHLDLLFGPQSNAHVVPHAMESGIDQPPRRRPAGRGIVMANLDPRKRVSHAIRAVAAAARSARSVELIIYGRGPEHDTLVAEIEELRAPARLEGYTSDPARAFADSSYLLLTSRHEGFGLVLVEAMATGCLPIAYDIDYGPADIVEHGVSGFLVAPGDEQALADQISWVATASRFKLRRLRKAARRRAAEFLPSSVLPRWEPVLEAAAERARARAARPEPSLADLRELESVAGLHRFADTRLEATIVDVSWDEHAVATVDVSCVVAGAGERTGELHVDAELVHRPTGARRTPPPVERLDTDSSTGHPTAMLRLTIDPATVEDPDDHVIVLRARLGAIDVLDTPRPEPEAPPWLPMPAATPTRPVLIPARRTGLRLVTASPKVAATVDVSGDDVLVEVTSLMSGGPIEGVEIQDETGNRSVRATADPGGGHRLTVSDEGLWSLRAYVDGTWRTVAWRGPETVPSGDGPVQLELSPRGYIKLRRDA